MDEINPKMLAKKAAPNADETSKPSAVNGVNLPHMEQSEDRAPRKSKRTVDEIIATLHDQSNA